MFIQQQPDAECASNTRVSFLIKNYIDLQEKDNNGFLYVYLLNIFRTVCS